MRLQTQAFIILFIAFVLTLGRDPAGRVGVFVFFTGIGEVALGLTAIMALFQALGAIGEARGLLEHADALAETAAVLAVGTAAMSAWLFVGAWCIQASLP